MRDEHFLVEAEIVETVEVKLVVNSWQVKVFVIHKLAGVVPQANEHLLFMATQRFYFLITFGTRIAKAIYIIL